jgi:hypothetical protein
VLGRRSSENNAGLARELNLVTRLTMTETHARSHGVGKKFFRSERDTP